MPFEVKPSDQPAVTAVVLAGGASSRMGRPKALLPFGDETLIERVLGRLAEVVEETVVVSGPHVDLSSLPLRVRVIEDQVPLQGPVAGILYGLRVARTDLCFVCSCDQPFLSPDLVRALIERAEGVDLAIPRWKGKLQPMCAVYRRSLLPLFERSVAAGQLRLRTVLAETHSREISDEEISRIDPQGLSFFDLDSPRAYREALRMVRKD